MVAFLNIPALFLHAEDRLSIFGEVDVEYTVGMKTTSRKNKRKDRHDIKEGDRSVDSTDRRGLTNHQLINVSHLKIQKSTLLHKVHERNMVSLKLSFDAITKEIDSSERIDERRCPEYNTENKWWKEVDSLMDERSQLHLWMRETNDSRIEDITTPCDVLMKNVEDSRSRLSNTMTPVSLLTSENSTSLVGGDEDIVELKFSPLDDEKELYFIEIQTN